MADKKSGQLHGFRFKKEYYLNYGIVDENGDDGGFQMAIICLAIFMLCFFVELWWVGMKETAIIAYCYAIFFVLIPVVITATKLYVLGEKRIKDNNRLSALDKTFEIYLGKECDAVKKEQLIVALLNAYSKSAEGIIGAGIECILFVMLQVCSFLVSLIPNFMNWDKVGMNGVYIWLLVNVMLVALSKRKIFEYLLYDDLLMFVSRKYRGYINDKLLQETGLE